MVPPPRLPEYDVSDVQFLTLGILLHGGKFERDIVSSLKGDFGWNAKSGYTAYYSLLKRFRQLGLIRSHKLGSERAYQLTKRGFERWKAALDYYRQAVAYWDAKASDPKLFRYTEDVETPPQVGPEYHERLPREDELAKLREKASPAFRRILDFALEAKVRLSTAANIEIGNCNFPEKVLEVQVYNTRGEPTKRTRVRLTDRAIEILKEAIGSETSGLVFRSPRGRPWTMQYLSHTLTKLKKRCGIPHDVVISGRGGRAMANRETQT